MTTALRTLIDRIEDMAAPERVTLQKYLDEADVLRQFEVWQPQAGPQTEGYFSEADLTLYGGAAGGGKTDLIAGLALFAHHKAAIFRQSLKSLKGLIERMNTLMGAAGLGKISGTAAHGYRFRRRPARQSLLPERHRRNERSGGRYRLPFAEKDRPGFR
ncbi:hypothetical protein [Roseibium sp.]|uniref:hypothetical protein n=1 Tax=Roseibium sp. TaxID=1936156 RepID=UPI003BAD541A